jgi:hypothetical protein
MKAMIDPGLYQSEGTGVGAGGLSILPQGT